VGFEIFNVDFWESVSGDFFIDTAGTGCDIPTCDEATFRAIHMLQPDEFVAQEMKA